LIEDPVNKSKSVVFTSAGLDEAARAFNAQFKKVTPAPQAVTYGGMVAEVTSAAGVRGTLCRSAVGSEYFFRVYGPDGLFTDHELRHDDLQVTIAPDELASFYKLGEVSVLDHSPKVLGLAVDSEASSADKEAAS